MDKNEFLDYLHKGDFKSLFLECFWNNPTTSAPYAFKVSEKTYCAQEVAQKGVKVYVLKVDAIPDSSTRRIIDTNLRKLSHDYLSVFVATAEEFHHLWSVPVKGVDKRQLVTVEYVNDDQATFLLEKMNAISFSVDSNPTVLDVVDRVNAAFLVNTERVTRNFYAGFKNEHKRFVAGIEGIPDDKEREWYSSVMLNRLMFCYFIQKKGFLNLDESYLQHKLAEVKAKRGEDKFYGTFYKRFLRKLFESGLNGKVRSEAFKREFGRIPYLNGGMFELHAIEKAHPDIDIPDAIFEKLFAFFDQWQWHLDTKLTASGRDINPDVLGYIFEQYINDRAQMGAYYTKEDITEYIGRNCIVPWLLEKTFGESKFPKWVKEHIKSSRSEYIFTAMLKGEGLPLPKEIERGIDTKKPNLRERRSEWNKPTPEEFALPAEIWRETIARLQRVKETKEKLADGTISEVNDFITYNLDIRKFAEDLIRNTTDHLFVSHFYKAVREVTVLDPTCGSGAFLFAALNILEPLYEACLDRMEEFHGKNDRLFNDELEEIKSKYRSNQKYFIYKNIILRNLYGVDIMHEATEIARLRLFLKMMAVVDVDPYAENLGLEPLPDIDFNIKCGNALVGYSSKNEIEVGLGNGDMFAWAEQERKIADILEKVALLYKQFRDGQLDPNADHAAIAEAKKTVNKGLAKLREILNKTLAASSYQISNDESKYDEWLANTQPFHWYAEFYQIMQARRGFDVIIGNPPYVEYTKKSHLSHKSISDIYRIKGYKTELTGNLYSYVLERSIMVSHATSLIGMIVPISSVSNQKFKPLMSLYSSQALLWLSSYSNRPGKLFEGVEQRLTIMLAKKGINIHGEFYSSDYQHWYVDERKMLFRRFGYCKNFVCSDLDALYKVGNSVSIKVWQKIRALSFSRLGFAYDSNAEGGVYYHNAPTYFVRAMPYKPNSDEGMRESSHYKEIPSAKSKRNGIACVLNSSLFYWFYKVISNCRDFSDREIGLFPIGGLRLEALDEEGSKLKDSYLSNKVIKSRDYSGSVVYYEEYYPAKSKVIIDKIDEILAKNYGFTEEELDYIINYDIKYRMGEELNVE